MEQNNSLLRIYSEVLAKNRNIFNFQHQKQIDINSRFKFCSEYHTYLLVRSCPFFAYVSSKKFSIMVQHQCTFYPDYIMHSYEFDIRHALITMGIFLLLHT